jgi:hypothetical protein
MTTLLGFDTNVMVGFAETELVADLPPGVNAFWPHAARAADSAHPRAKRTRREAIPGRARRQRRATKFIICVSLY